MSHGREMNPDLMRASRFETALQFGHLGRAAVLGDRAITGTGRLAIDDHGHTQRIAMVPTNWCIDQTVRRLEMSPCQGVIRTSDCSGCKCRNQRFVRPLATRYHHQATRADIESVHDSRTHRLADFGNFGVQSEHGVDQSAVRVTMTRMHYQTGRLIHHDDVIVREDNGYVD